VDRANKKLINVSVYLSQYALKIYHLAGKKNLVPDALSRLAAVGDPEERPEGIVILDQVWDTDTAYLTMAEAEMEPSLKDRYMQGYETDRKYAPIIEDLRKSPINGNGNSNEDIGNTFFRPGYPFILTNGLLYNIKPDGSRCLCIPYNMIKDLLEETHDQKHHWGRDRMLYDLRGYSVNKKTHEVKQYIKHCPTCQLNATDRQQPIGNYQPVRPGDILPMRTFAIDFIVGLPSVPSANTP
jgi:Integrase zinc binding domain